jgi:N-acetylneuraminic acid mutarotase
MPIAVHHPAAAVVDGLLIVIGGFPGGGLREATDAVQVFDPASGTWRLGALMPAARGGLAAVAVDGRVIVAGGADRGRSVADVRSYDPATDSWAELPSMPTARDHLALVMLDGHVHALGGRNQRSFTLAAHEVFDPVANSWSIAAPLPTGRSGHAAAVVGDCLYALGGEGNEARRDGLFAQVERYSSLTKGWTELEPMPNPRHGMSAIALEGRIAVVGGGAVAGMGAVNVVDAFVPAACG